MMTRDFEIRKGQLEDLPELQNLFVDTITTICKNNYNSEQIELWTSHTKTNANKKR